MSNAILGRKLGMTQVWDEDDNMVPVTVVEAGPCAISQVKTEESDGYDAIQIGFGDIKSNKVNKPMEGHFDKAGVKPVRYLREVRVDDATSYAPGDVITVDIFSDTKKVDVTGTSKGKGFAGVMKRHNFHGGPNSHGCNEFHRRTGSIGQHTYPARVFKGKKMPGHMGNKRVTVRNLKVVRVDAEQNVILIRGAVPGPNNGLVMIREAN